MLTNPAIILLLHILHVHNTHTFTLCVNNIYALYYYIKNAHDFLHFYTIKNAIRIFGCI